MDDARTRDALVQFLDYMSQKGLMAKATASGRKAAATKILGILDDQEASDVTSLNIDDVVDRFSRLHGRAYTPGSLNTYKSRLQSAVDDFRSYLANPLAFRPSVQNRGDRGAKSPKDGSGPKPRPTLSDPTPSTQPEGRVEQRYASSPFSANIIPIAIRADLTVFVQGLPFDLTEAEARKIAAVITAMGSV